MSPRLSILEAALLLFMFVGVTGSLITAFVAPEVYETILSVEDGPLEWATALSLFAASLICFVRVVSKRGKGTRYIIVTLLAGIVLFFGAGEEISWGQRIFGWASGEFFQENNAQFETNLHNLLVAGVKVNRVLFGVMLTIAFVIYFVAVPLLVRRKEQFRDFINSWFVPLPKPVFSYAFVLAMLGMMAIPSGRSPEVGEFAIGLLFALIVLRPANETEVL